jgi:hypothetical protein
MPRLVPYSKQLRYGCEAQVEKVLYFPHNEGTIQWRKQFYEKKNIGP